MKVFICLSFCVAVAVSSSSQIDFTGKTASQTSTLAGFPAGQAIDGDMSTRSSTDPIDGSGYWLLDLEKPYSISKIVIENLNAAVTMEGAVAEIMDKGPNDASSKSYQCGVIRFIGTSTFDCDITFSARFIRVSNSTPVAMDELRAYERGINLGPLSYQDGESTTSGRSSSGFNKVPLTGKPLSSSSVKSGSREESVIDGSDRTFFETSDAVSGPAFWQIDLEDNYDVTRIITHFPSRVSVWLVNRTVLLSLDQTFGSQIFTCGVGIGDYITTNNCQVPSPVRYVRVTIDPGPLMLIEVEVYVGKDNELTSAGTTIVTSTSVKTSPATIPTSEASDTVSVTISSIGTSYATATAATPLSTTATSGSAYRIMPGHTLEVPTATLTTPTVTMCSMWCQQSPGCTAFSFNNALKINNCKTSAIGGIMLSPGWTANIKSSVMAFPLNGYSCS